MNSSTAYGSPKNCSSGVILFEESPFDYLQSFLSFCGKDIHAPPSLAEIETFLSDGFDAHLTPDYEADFRRAASGAVYWLKFVEGYFEWRVSGYCVSGENGFLVHLRKLFLATKFDPGLEKEFEDERFIRDRVDRRFWTLHNLHLVPDHEAEPIIIFAASSSEKKVLVRTKAEKSMLGYSDIDGYHRIFSSLIAGKKSIHCDIKNLGSDTD